MVVGAAGYDRPRLCQGPGPRMAPGSSTGPDDTMAPGGSTGHPDVYRSAEAQHLDTSMALSDSPGS